MQVYIPFELEQKLRLWAKENNRSISSIVVEGVGKILITSSPEKPTEVTYEKYESA